MSFPGKYKFADIEKKWSFVWDEEGIYSWSEGKSTKEENFVIDNPPPTISGNLHMGHIFSYCHTDFIARFRRMAGYNVFYSMGFDDNGLPTERLTEKCHKVRGAHLTHEEFAEKCKSVSEEYRGVFRSLFKTVGLSVDWNLEYSTSDDRSVKVSQESFLKSYHSGKAYMANKPCYWDVIDRTAVAHAEIVDKVMPSFMNYIKMQCFSPSGQRLDDVEIATTRPEMIGACVAVLFNPTDDRYKSFLSSDGGASGYYIMTPAGCTVPLLPDLSVLTDKGSGLVMLCSFGDEQDVRWIGSEYVCNSCRFTFKGYPIVIARNGLMQSAIGDESIQKGSHISSIVIDNEELIGSSSLWTVQNVDSFMAFGQVCNGKKIAQARADVILWLEESNLLAKKDAIEHSVKCAERSGAPLELLPSPQWYIDVLGIRDKLSDLSDELKWYPETMKIKLDQWIENLRFDWCVSRQRYCDVMFPLWYVFIGEDKDSGRLLPVKSGDDSMRYTIVVPAELESLPMRANSDVPSIFMASGSKVDTGSISVGHEVDLTGDAQQVMNHCRVLDTHYGEVERGSDLHVQILSCLNDGKFLLFSDGSVMDTWATSSLTPNINAAYKDGKFGNILYPADLRAQAQEIIRTWAFYTMARSWLDHNSLPWENIMVSGWCLAADKTKMSKSKGNATQPDDLLNRYGADAVRYWASNTRLGTDISFREDAVEVGNKFITKLWNATNFVLMHIDHFSGDGPASDIKSGVIFCDLDLWILSKLAKVVKECTDSFYNFDYYTARMVVEDFFLRDFCDNYLELTKARVYRGKSSIAAEEQMSAVNTLCYCLRYVVTMLAPFVPYVAEEIYSHICVAHGSVHMKGRWPKDTELEINTEAERIGDLCVEILSHVRRIKTIHKVSIKKDCKIHIACKNNVTISDSAIKDLTFAMNGEVVWQKVNEASEDHGYSDTELSNYLIRMSFEQ